MFNARQNFLFNGDLKMKAKPILEKYQYEKAVELYVKRMSEGYYKDKVYPLNKVGHFIGSTSSDNIGHPTTIHYHGRFKDCIIQFILDGIYFNEWVSPSFDQITNCNNGDLTLYKPEVFKPTKVKKYIL